MTQEEKQLLIKDLCARLPYGVKIIFEHNGFRWDWEQTLDEIRLCEDGEWAINGWGIHGIKPYLRPMSSMTEEEQEEYDKWHEELEEGRIKDWKYAEYNDWLNAHYLDYRGLIPMGLALEASKDMYKQ